AAVDLPEAGQARCHHQALVVPVLVGRDLAGYRRAGADDAHLAEQDVDELRQLVQAGAAQEAPDTGPARIVLEFEQQLALAVDRLQLGLALLGVLAHRAELVAGEAAAVLADPDLAE